MILQGILIGGMFGIPVGVMGALCIQRVIKYNYISGLVTGLASSCVDFLFACAGAFGFVFISDFIQNYQIYFNCLFATVILLAGLSTFINPNVFKLVKSLNISSYKMLFISTILIGIMNPASIFSYLFAFSFFHISESLTLINGLKLAVGVFVGTMIWWLFLITIIDQLKKRLHSKWLNRINYFFGLVLLCVSIFIFYKTFFIK